MKALNKRMSGLPWPLALLNNSYVIILIILVVLYPFFQEKRTNG